MKNLLIEVALIFGAGNLYAQNQTFKSIENNSSCDVVVTIYYFGLDECEFEAGQKQTYTVKSNDFASATAPSGFEFAYAEVTFKDCASNAKLTVGAPTACGPCNVDPTYPSQVSGSLASCELGCPTITVTWHCDAHLMIE